MPKRFILAGAACRPVRQSDDAPFTAAAFPGQNGAPPSFRAGVTTEPGQPYFHVISQRHNQDLP
jgi:hypothetical protein